MTHFKKQTRNQQRDSYPGRHRVALVWLFDRINPDAQIQVKYFDTKHQIEALFTRHEWNSLLLLFEISIFSSASCPGTMSKRMQQGTGQEGIVAKSKPTMNLVPRSVASSPTAPSWSASSRSGDTKSTQSKRFESLALCRETSRWSSSQNDAASSSQVWLTDAKLRERARKLAAVDTSRGQRFPESARKLAAQNLDIIDEASTKWPHSLRVSRAHVPHLENVHSNLRRQLKREPEDKTEDLNSNTLMWGPFMLVTQQAAIFF